MDIDVDSEIDMISGQFRSMSTNDKDSLIAEFKRLSNTDLSNEGCLFYLDLAEWNLNAALWSYYEYQTQATTSTSTSTSTTIAASATTATTTTIPTTTIPATVDSSVATTSTSLIAFSAPQMQLDEPSQLEQQRTVACAPGATFSRRWTFVNECATQRWPVDCYLKYFRGHVLQLAENRLPGESRSVSDLLARVESLEPTRRASVTLSFIAPAQRGSYECELRLFTLSNRTPFGKSFLIRVTVVDDEQNIAEATRDAGNSHSTLANSEKASDFCDDMLG